MPPAQAAADGSCGGRGSRVGRLTALVALLVPPAGDAITCLHSTCSDGYCMSQDAIDTVTVDCDTLGASDSNCAFDVCEVRKVRLCANCDTQILHKCKSSCLADKAQTKCTVTVAGLRYWGDEPFSADGLTSTTQSGSSTKVNCCTQDACNTQALVAGSIDTGEGGTDTPVGQIDYNGWYYAQDPSWQVAGGRNCICDPNSFAAPCTPNVAFNPLLPAIPAAEIGSCHLLDESNGFNANQRRLKLEGTGAIPGFAEGVSSIEVDRWKGYCVHCDGVNGSAIHFYKDTRCSIAALVKSIEIQANGECTNDPSRSADHPNFHYKAVCKGVDHLDGTLPCPGTVPNNNVLSVGVYTNSECRGTGVGRDWALRLLDLPSLTAGAKCLRFADLEKGQGELGQTTHLFNEILATANFASSKGFDTGLFGPASEASSNSGPGVTPHLPSLATLSLKLCATATEVTIAWFSDPACMRPVAFDPATAITVGVAEPSAPYSVTGLTYPLGKCVPASAMPYRSSISDGSKGGISGANRWLFAEWNENASLSTSCPTLAPAPPPDRDCAGSWSKCTAACEPAGARTWSERASQTGDGNACPAPVDCTPGVDDCVAAAATAAAVGIGIGAVIAVIVLILLVLGVVGALHRRRLRRRVILAMQSHAEPDMKSMAKKLKGKARDAAARGKNRDGGSSSSSGGSGGSSSSEEEEKEEEEQEHIEVGMVDDYLQETENGHGKKKQPKPSKQQGNLDRGGDDSAALSSDSSKSADEEWSGGLHKTPYQGGRGRGYGRARSRATSMLRGRGRASSRDAQAEAVAAQQQAAKERARAKAASKVRAKQEAEEMVAAQVKQNAKDRAKAKAAAKAASSRMAKQSGTATIVELDGTSSEEDLTEAERAMLDLDQDELAALQENMAVTYAHFPSTATKGLQSTLPFAEVD
eukprot:COSAG05_NODE_1840_length_3984_cov_2.130759_1_plen_926_part_00